MPHVIYRIAMRREGRLVAALAGALCALAIAAQPSHAGVLVASSPSCDAAETSRPFLRWLDIASYAPAPNGGFEAGAAGWGPDGATPLAGHQPHHVGGDAPDSPPPVPPGGSAESPPLCVR